MSDHKITYFPVGNGDSVLITLKDDTNIIIDCNFTSDSEDENAKDRFDVKSYLLNCIGIDNEIPYIDTFILTHPDQDHCRNFEKHFYLDGPDKYTDEDKQEGKIRIDEIWFAPRVFSNHEELCEDAQAFKKEVERRIEVYKNDSSKVADRGNRVRIIGYSDNPKLEGLQDIITVPGNEINIINNDNKNNFTFFILGPLKADTDDEENGRNDASIVMQAKFKVRETEDAGLAIFGGDAGANNWARIIEQNNDLSFDILLAPHHCSRYFFNEEKEDEDELNTLEEIQTFLENGQDGCCVIASSKVIKDDDDNPPHYLAFKEYKKYVNDDKFVCLSEYPDENEPKSLVFIVTENGPIIDDTNENEANNKKDIAFIRKVASSPKTYGV